MRLSQYTEGLHMHGSSPCPGPRTNRPHSGPNEENTMWDVIIFVAGCCVGATFHVVIGGWMRKAKEKAKQAADSMR